MNHISFESGVYDFTKYFAYLNSIRQRLGDHLYVFASDPQRYYFNSPTTLHDAWVESSSFISDLKSDDGETSYQVKFLGPYHDRVFILDYLRVSEIEINWRKLINPLDLIAHEFRVCGDKIEHEYLFDQEIKWRIQCEDIRWSEKLLLPTSI